MTHSSELIHQLYQIGAIQFGQFTLKSGQNSSIYINLRKIISYPALLSTIAEAMWQRVKDRSNDLICGVPYTALPIATCLSLHHHIPMVMRRKEKEDYGTKQIIEGDFKQSEHCLVIEDLITTGSSIIETVTDLEEAGLIVTDVIALIDREQGGKETLTKKYNTQTVLSLSEILSTLLDSTKINSNDKDLIKKFIDERSR